MKEKGKEKLNSKDKDNKQENEINMGELIEEENEINENENEIDQNQSYNSILEKQKDNDLKLIGKEQSKLNIYQKYERKFSIPKYRMKFNESPNILYNEGFHIAFGGFWNGDIIIRQIIDIKTDSKKTKNKKINIIKTGELSPITKILIDKTDTIAICSNYEGTIFVFIIDQNDKFDWNIHKIISEGQGEISTITINESLFIFIVCFKNGYNMIYTLPNCKLINSFKIEENDLSRRIEIQDNNEKSNENESINSTPTSTSTPTPTPIPNSNNIYTPDLTFISNSPLPCFIFYIKERKSLCVYSINAHFLNEYNLGYEIVENGIKKFTDNFFKDYLFIYNSINNTIDVHQLVDMQLIISSPLINHQFIDFQFTKDFDYALILVKVKQQKNDEKSQNKMLALKQITPESGNLFFLK